MQRLVIIVAIAALGAGAWFVLTWKPRVEQPTIAAPPTAPAAPAPTSEPDAAPMTAPAPPTAPPPPPASEAAAETAPAGPFVVTLGPYPLALRDSKKKLRAGIELTTDNDVTLRELRGRREQLRRMMYFLSAHRTEESAQGEAGKARFLADLSERFRNVVKTGDLDKIELTTYVIEDAAPESDAPPSAP